MNQTSLRDTIENSYKRSSRYKKFTNEEDRALDLSDLLQTVRKVSEWSGELAMGWLNLPHVIQPDPLLSLTPPPSPKRMKGTDRSYKDLKEFSSLLKIIDRAHALSDCTLVEWLGRAMLPIFEAKLVESEPDMAPRACPRFKMNVPRISPESFAGANRLMMATTRLLAELSLPPYAVVETKKIDPKTNLMVVTTRNVSMTCVPLSSDLIKDLKEGFKVVVLKKTAELLEEIQTHEDEADRAKTLAKSSTHSWTKTAQWETHRQQTELAKKAIQQKDRFDLLVTGYMDMFGKTLKEKWVIELKDYEQGLIEYRDAFKEHRLAVQTFKREEKEARDHAEWRSDLIKHARDQIGIQLTRYFNVDGWHKGKEIKAMGMTKKGDWEEPPVTGTLATQQMLVSSQPLPLPPVGSNPPPPISAGMRNHIVMSEATRELDLSEARVREGILEAIQNDQGQLKQMAFRLGELLVQRGVQPSVQTDKEIAELKAALALKIQVLKELSRSASETHLEGILSGQSEQATADDEIEHLFKIYGMSQKIVDSLDRKKNREEDMAFKEKQFEFQKEQFKAQQDAREAQEARKALETAAIANGKITDEIKLIRQSLTKLESETCKALERDYLETVRPPLSPGLTLSTVRNELKESVLQLIEEHCRRESYNSSGLVKKEMDRLQQLITKEELLHAEACTRLGLLWSKWAGDLQSKVDQLSLTPATTFTSYANELLKIDNARDQAIHAFQSAKKNSNELDQVMKKKEQDFDSRELIKKAQKKIKETGGDLEKLRTRAQDLARTLQKTIDRLYSISTQNTVSRSTASFIKQLRTKAQDLIKTFTKPIIDTLKDEQIQAVKQQAQNALDVFTEAVTFKPSIATPDTAGDLTQLFVRTIPLVFGDSFLTLSTGQEEELVLFAVEADKCVGDWDKTIPTGVKVDFNNDEVNELFVRVLFPVWRSDPSLVKSRNSNPGGNQTTITDMETKMKTSFGEVFKYTSDLKEKGLRKRIPQLYCFMVGGVKHALDLAIEDLEQARGVLEAIKSADNGITNNKSQDVRLALISVKNSLVRACICHKAVEYQTQFLANMEVLVPGVSLTSDPKVDFVFDASKLHRAINRIFSDQKITLLVQKLMRSKATTVSVDQLANLKSIETIIGGAQRCNGYRAFQSLSTSLPVGELTGTLTEWINTQPICNFEDNDLIWMNGGQDNFAQAWINIALGETTMKKVDDLRVPLVVDSSTPNTIYPVRPAPPLYKGTEDNISTFSLNDEVKYGVPSTIPGADKPSTPWIYRRRFVGYGTYNRPLGRITIAKEEVECSDKEDQLVGRYTIQPRRLDRETDPVMNIFFQSSSGKEYLVAFSQKKTDGAKCALFALC